MTAAPPVTAFARFNPAQPGARGMKIAATGLLLVMAAIFLTARAYEQVVKRPQERCDSYDAPACYRAMEATYWLGRLKDEAGDKAGAAPLLQRFITTRAGASGP